jgi:hypothetical protein
MQVALGCWPGGLSAGGNPGGGGISLVLGCLTPLGAAAIVGALFMKHASAIGNSFIVECEMRAHSELYRVARRCCRTGARHDASARRGGRRLAEPLGPAASGEENVEPLAQQQLEMSPSDNWIRNELASGTTDSSFAWDAVERAAKPSIDLARLGAKVQRSKRNWYEQRAADIDRAVEHGTQKCELARPPEGEAQR